MIALRVNVTLYTIGWTLCGIVLGLCGIYYLVEGVRVISNRVLIIFDGANRNVKWKTGLLFVSRMYRNDYRDIESVYVWNIRSDEKDTVTIWNVCVRMNNGMKIELGYSSNVNTVEAIVSRISGLTNARNVRETLE
jgi:hypothetical protein